MKNSGETIENRTRGLPACSSVSQPTVPPRAPYIYIYIYIYYHYLQASLSNNMASKHSVNIQKFPALDTYLLHKGKIVCGLL